MRIKLGIFTHMWHPCYDKDILKGSIDYPFINVLTPEERYNAASSIVDDVLLAASRVGGIDFVLDGIKLPLTEDSITCQELEAIIRDDSLVAKTIFWVNFKIVPTEDVMDVYSKVEHNELKFNDIFK